MALIRISEFATMNAGEIPDGSLIPIIVEIEGIKRNKLVTVDEARILIGSIQEAKDYADSLVVGLLDDRGNWSPGSGNWPDEGGSGVDGVIMKGDVYYITADGTLTGSVQVKNGDSIRALVDSPGQDPEGWALMEKDPTLPISTNVAADGTSNTKVPSVKAVKDYVDANASAPAYLKYVALISQDGSSAPTAVVLENTLGFTPTFSRTSAGHYNINTASLGSGLNTKRWVSMQHPNADRNFTLDNTYKQYILLSMSGGPFGGDSSLVSNSIEIRVYP